MAEKPSLGAYIKKTAPYAAAILAFLLFGGFLYGYKEDQVQVSFTYDVGTITGGVLVGTAALIAATAYLKKSTEESNERSDRNLQ